MAAKKRPVVGPVRTAVPFWGRITYNLTYLSPKRACGSKRVIIASRVPAETGMYIVVYSQV